jgi:hypothetical protein
MGLEGSLAVARRNLAKRKAKLAAHPDPDSMSAYRLKQRIEADKQSIGWLKEDIAASKREEQA